MRKHAIAGIVFLLLFPILGLDIRGETDVTDLNKIRAGAAAVNITPPVGCILSGWAARDGTSR